MTKRCDKSKTWTDYSWDPLTEVATFLDESSGDSRTEHQPLLPHVKQQLKRGSKL